MYVILSMILSGSILLLLFIVLKKIFKESFDYKLQITVLKVCLLLFILPLSFIRDLADIVLYDISGINFTDMTLIKGSIPTVIFTDGDIVVNPAMHTMIGIFILWLLLACAICAYHLFLYWKSKKFAFSSAEAIQSDPLCSFLKDQAKAMNIGREIKLYQSNAIVSAYTMGTLHPVIILPANRVEAEQKIIILHELRHIKNHDTLINFLCLICKGIYWFNPFIYVLDSLLKQTMELACDNWVTQQLNQDSKFLYAHLIITMSRKQSLSGKYSSYFTKNQKRIEERVDCIMNKPRKHNFRHFIATIAAVVAIALSSIPAFASPSVQILSISADFLSELSYDSNVTASYQEYGPDYDDIWDVADTIELPIIYDKQFISIDGQIYDMTDGLPEPRINCDHVFTDGKYTEHLVKSNGGCVIRFFASQRCQKCSCVEKGELLNELSYPKCPH